MKLSNKQKEVIALMREGWNLGVDSFAEFIHLQQGGLGYGGISNYVNGNTFNSLKVRGLICFLNERYPVKEYALTELGKTINID